MPDGADVANEVLSSFGEGAQDASTAGAGNGRWLSIAIQHAILTLVILIPPSSPKEPRPLRNRATFGVGRPTGPPVAREYQDVEPPAVPDPYGANASPTRADTMKCKWFATAFELLSR